MSATPVSICSNALLMLGDTTISSFDDGTDRSRLAANTWESARDYVLRSHPWNCATKRVILAPDAQAPAFGWNYQFQLPADWLRTISVGEEGERPGYKIEGRKILFDQKELKLLYLWRNEVPATWDTLLVHTMTLVMRAIFSYPITQSGGVEQLVESTLQPILRQARSVDGQEDPPDALDDCPLLQARFMGGGGYDRYRRGW
ncbi:hypothetical protein CDN99_06640 [Roseateles aquatilis]|uniref:Uncharacterized protein n=1 Tax=Roseateles aquatilis TaxID=431061 RepID=A0A246JHN3_9BURK|nr:hypothetical protein [Roseateles aquatilis]OWQ92030.1 hypothetical protein CDN99_06640 [Roseateles aquatilis]